jgi:hypothetical protein
MFNSSLRGEEEPGVFVIITSAIFVNGLRRNSDEVWLIEIGG